MICLKYSCSMGEASCLERQRLSNSKFKQKAEKFKLRDPGCENCKQGRAIWRKHYGKRLEDTGAMEKPQPKFKQCKNADCKHKGQMLEVKKHFYKNSKSTDGLFAECKDCHNERQKRNAKERRKKEQQQIYKSEVGKKEKSDVRLDIDFTGHEELLKQLKAVAASELRSPENQALYWLRGKLESEQ